MKNIHYIKEIIIIISLGILLGFIRNYFLSEPLDFYKEKKVLNSISGTSIPKMLDEPMSIDIDLAYYLFSNKSLFIDARDSEDYDNEHIVNAINIPYEEFESYTDTILDLNTQQPVIIYCSGGECDLSMHLGDVLFDEFEFEKVLIFEAGYPAWKELGYPVE